MNTITDAQLGEKLRALRKRSALSMEELCLRTGITVKQLQKYECGVNRISAISLFKFSKALDTPIDSFFDR